ncbi:hypothetical protein FA13DRAFT_1717344 [Coprinellus micaceus]|uniref:Uncharacterized protein n=1 Tax=Coprinellus micaceus TaxID=71717 RepID=A0A4Y7SGL9_COPMI|nr:hypothetical protein FA13DRAFT_1717344 [Coprinellus micaceus]
MSGPNSSAILSVTSFKVSPPGVERYRQMNQRRLVDPRQETRPESPATRTPTFWRKESTMSSCAPRPRIQCSGHIVVNAELGEHDAGLFTAEVGAYVVSVNVGPLTSESGSNATSGGSVLRSAVNARALVPDRSLERDDMERDGKGLVVARSAFKVVTAGRQDNASCLRLHPVHEIIEQTEWHHRSSSPRKSSGFNSGIEVQHRWFKRQDNVVEVCPSAESGEEPQFHKRNRKQNRTSGSRKTPNATTPTIMGKMVHSGCGVVLLQQASRSEGSAFGIDARSLPPTLSSKRSSSKRTGFSRGHRAESGSI